MRKSIFLLFMLVFLLISNLVVFAQERTSNLVTMPDKNIYTIDDVVYSSPYVPEEISPRAVWVTYDKTVVLFSVHELMDPSLSDWPQTIYYTEPNPMGYGDDAWGTLYLKSAERIPGSFSAWNLTYKGKMGYYLY